MIKAALIALLLCLALGPVGCGGDSQGAAATPTQSPRQAANRDEPNLRPPEGPPPEDLVVRDLILGSGAVARPGDELTVEYIGIRYDGSPFTNSWERSKPFRFRLGANSFRVNPGWEKGLRGMRVGGRRELVIPPKLLFQGGALPESKPMDTLVYVIDLVALN